MVVPTAEVVASGGNVADVENRVGVGGFSAGLPLLADAASWATSFVNVFVGVYTLLIFAYVLLSWIRLPYSPTLERVQRFLYETCDPYLRLFRRIVPPLGAIDLSPIVAIFALVIVRQLANVLIERLL
jgi:YggT family protein